MSISARLNAFRKFVPAKDSMSLVSVASCRSMVMIRLKAAFGPASPSRSITRNVRSPIARISDELVLRLIEPIDEFARRIAAEIDFEQPAIAAFPFSLLARLACPAAEAAAPGHKAVCRRV